MNILLLLSWLACSGHAAGLFGTHADMDGSMSGEAGAEVTRALIFWGRVEPRKGDYDWERIDRYLRGRQAAGVGSDGVSLMPTSPWGGCEEANRLMRRRRAPQFHDCMPRDLEAWLAFVLAVVERYDGDGKDDMPGLTKPIKYWQVYNEWVHQWIGTREEFFGFHRLTAAAVRRADPGAKVIAAAITGDEVYARMDGYGDGPAEIPGRLSGDGELEPRRFSRRELWSSPKARGKKADVEAYLGLCGAYDVVDLHFYGDVENLPASLRWVRDAVKARCGKEKPVWMIEAASPFFGFSEERFERDVVKLYATAFREGAQAVFWSSLWPTEGFPENFLRLSLLDGEGNKKTAFFVYQRMTRTLKGFSRALPLAPGVPADGAAFLVRGRPVAVLWAPRERRGVSVDLRQILLAEGWRVTTAHGERVEPDGHRLSVGDEPVYVEAGSSSR